MPLYDYRCEGCGDFRAFRPMSESNASLPCPRCGAACARPLTVPFLGGGAASGWLGQPRPVGHGGSWRAACGFGCSHAGCG